MQREAAIAEVDPRPANLVPGNDGADDKKTFTVAAYTCKRDPRHGGFNLVKRRILFVDDDPDVLQGLKRTLRCLRSEWEVQFAESAPAALALLEVSRFDVVVSDMQMAGMDGPDFLSEVMVCYPGVARIALSGSVDIELILRSVKPVHQFLSKPCEPETLRLAIRRVLAIRDLMESPDLRSMISQLKSVPSLPSLYDAVVEELESENPSLKNVGRIITSDIGMTARILQLVNSSFFGLRCRVSDPGHAARLLGLNTVKDLVLAIHVFSSYEGIGGGLITVESAWRHSMRVARFAQEIARAEGGDDTLLSDSRGAGTLHDIGQLVLLANFSEGYKEVLDHVVREGMDLSTAETEAFGASHGELGAYLLGLWGLPEPLVEAVAFHHHPRRGAAGGFTPRTAVHIANVLDHELRPEDMPWSRPGIVEEYLEELALAGRLSEWRAICAQISVEIAEGS